MRTKSFQAVLMVMLLFLSSPNTYGQFTFTINGNSSNFTLSDCNDDLKLISPLVSFNIIGYRKVTWELYRNDVVIDKKEQEFFGVGSNSSGVEFQRPSVPGAYRIDSNVSSSTNTITVLAPYSPSTNMKINGSSSGPSYICDDSPIIMDGSASQCEDGYYVEVDGYSKWFTGQRVPNNFDIRSFCSGHVSLATGKPHRIKLAISPGWHEIVRTVYTVSNNVVLLDQEINQTTYNTVASNSIKLLPGFKYSASTNSHLFHAYTHDCQ
jgi:hypothetical protein